MAIPPAVMLGMTRMDNLGKLLLYSGLVIGITGEIRLLIAAFQQSRTWGLLCVFVPCIVPIFLIVCWERARNPFLIWMTGIVLIILGDALLEQHV